MRLSVAPRNTQPKCGSEPGPGFHPIVSVSLKGAVCRTSARVDAVDVHARQGYGNGKRAVAHSLLVRTLPALHLPPQMLLFASTYCYCEAGISTRWKRWHGLEVCGGGQVDIFGMRSFASSSATYSDVIRVL